MNLTKKRKEILDKLESVHGVISARALAQMLPDVDQATVYRNLDLFVKKGEAKKFLFEGSEAVYERTIKDHHHAVCSNCEKVIHLDISDKRLVGLIDTDGFDVTSVELIVRGQCK